MGNDERVKTVALRYADNFAPECGTIAAHRELIDELGFVWYGKLGSPISKEAADMILESGDPKILLIHSGSQERFWAHVKEIRRSTPPQAEIPEYYRSNADKFSCWFRVSRFEKAPKDIMSKCIVSSSGKKLSSASRHSMSPYFKIELDEDEGKND